MKYEVKNGTTNESHGWYEDLDEAYGCIRFDRLKFWQVWHANGNLIAEKMEGGAR